MAYSDIKYSIIIPTYNRAEILIKCLENLNNLQPVEFEYEILVIDNGSTDNTKDLVESLAQRNKKIRYYYDSRPGLHIGRNTGAKMAGGEILCFIDDDSFVFPEWLEGIEETFKDKDTVLAGGPILPKYETEPPEWLKFFWEKNDDWISLSHLSIGYLKNLRKEISPTNVYGCNFIIRKDIYFKFGGSRPDCMPKKYEFFQGNGESGLATRLKIAGYNAVYNEKIKIHHLVSSARMTAEYFIEHARYQAIVFSYTQMQNKYFYGLMEKKTKFIKIKHLINKFKYFKWKYLRYLHVLLSKGPVSVKKIKLKIIVSFDRTLKEYQELFYKDKYLREWVLKPDYLEKHGTLDLLRINEYKN